MQWYSAVIDYPHNIGGRPLHSWPAFIPVTFETTVLGAALAAVFGHAVGERPAAALPPGLQRAGVRAGVDDRFFLSIQARDPLFDPETTELLATFHPKVITVVPH